MPASGDSAVGGCQEMIGQARSAYYNPRREGFGGFKASIRPNWKLILGHTSTRQNLKVFRSIRFSMDLDANGGVTVKHEMAASEEARVEAYVKEIHENVQRLVSGFFGIWTVFMITSPFPENGSPLRVDNQAKECRLFFTTETADVVLAMTNDLLITELKLSSPRSSRTIKPVFQKTSEGLLLKGYRSLFEPVAEGVKTELEATIEYQAVDGMKLPHKLEIRGLLGTEPIAAELRFDQYVLNPRVTRPVVELRYSPSARKSFAALCQPL
jgi:hypothetical protein